MVAAFLVGMAVVYVPAMCTIAAYLLTVLLRMPQHCDLCHEFPLTALFTVVVLAVVWPVTLPYILFGSTPKRPT